jgi:hypothetical protein
MNRLLPFICQHLEIILEESRIVPDTHEHIPKSIKRMPVTIYFWQARQKLPILNNH